MSLRTKITTVALTALAALALAGCSAVSDAETHAESSSVTADATAKPASDVTPDEATPEPTSTKTPCPTGRINYPNYAYNTEPVETPELVGEITDTGSREFATGDPTLDENGEIVSYTVQSGDAAEAIAARFCIDSLSFTGFNNTVGKPIQPGEVLILRPDPNAPWSPQE